MRGVSDQAVHPLYDPTTWEYDIGLVTLDRSVSVSAYIRPVCLPLLPGDLGQGKHKTWVVTGWGTTDPYRVKNAQTLQQVQVSKLGKVKEKLNIANYDVLNIVVVVFIIFVAVHIRFTYAE